MRIITSIYALQASKERLFPASRHRSARIRKKLIQRHGGEFRMVPAAYRHPGGIVAHPSIVERVRAEVEAAARAELRPLVGNSPTVFFIDEIAALGL